VFTDLKKKKTSRYFWSNCEQSIAEVAKKKFED